MADRSLRPHAHVRVERLRDQISRGWGPELTVDERLHLELADEVDEGRAEFERLRADLAAARVFAGRLAAVAFPRATTALVDSLVAALSPDRPTPCPTCTWPYRETVDMVCQTCGTDYGATT